MSPRRNSRPVTRALNSFKLKITTKLQEIHRSVNVTAKRGQTWQNLLTTYPVQIPLNVLQSRRIYVCTTNYTQTSGKGVRAELGDEIGELMDKLKLKSTRRRKIRLCSGPKLSSVETATVEPTAGPSSRSLRSDTSNITNSVNQDIPNGGDEDTDLLNDINEYPATPGFEIEAGLSQDGIEMDFEAKQKSADRYTKLPIDVFLRARAEFRTIKGKRDGRVWDRYNVGAPRLCLLLLKLFDE